MKPYTVLFIIINLFLWSLNAIGQIENYGFDETIPPGELGVTGTLHPIQYEDKLFLFFQGAGHHHQLEFRIKSGDQWSRYYNVPNTVIHGSPSPIVYKDELFVFHTDGNDQARIEYNKLVDGKWTSDHVLEGVKTTDSPSAVVYKNKIYVFHRGTNGALYYALYDGNKWSKDIAVPQSPKLNYSPNAVIYKDKVYIFHRDDVSTKKRLFYTVLNGDKFEGDHESGIHMKLTFQPGVTVYKDKIYILHHDSDKGHDLYFTSFDGESKWTEDRKVNDIRISDGPTPYVMGDDLYVFINSGWNEYEIRYFVMKEDGSHTSTSLLHTFSLEKTGYLDMPLGSFTILGTHNSFISSPEFLAPNRNSFRKIQWQLDQGVRFIEMDVNYSPFPFNANVEKSVAVMHGDIYGTSTFGQRPIMGPLHELMEWLNAHPKEFILLKIDSPGHVSESDLLYFYKKSGLINKIYTTKKDWSDVTAREVINSGKQIVMMDACGKSVKSNIEDYMTRSSQWGGKSVEEQDAEAPDKGAPLYYPGLYGTEDPFGFGSHSIDQYLNQYDFMLKYAIEGWRKTTTRPFSVVIDFSSYGSPLEVIRSLNNEFNSIKGKVLDEKGNEIKDVEYKCTYEYLGEHLKVKGVGHFDFPVRIGETVTVKPSVNGKSLSPASISYTNTDNKNKEIDFRATTTAAMKEKKESSNANDQQEMDDVIAYPNPAIDQVSFNLNLEKPTDLNLNVFSINGQLVGSENYEGLSKGMNCLQFKLPKNILTGLYIYHLKGDGFERSGKLVKE